MFKKITFLLLVITFALCLQVSGQTDKTSEKNAVLKELVTMMSEDSPADQLVALFSAQADSVREKTIQTLIDGRTDLSAADKKELFETLTANQKEISRRVTEKLLQKLNFDEMIREIGMTVYDKYYTLEEIKEILAFYKTPTGEKLRKSMMPLMNDTMVLVNERLIPKIPVVMKEIEEEQKAEIAREIEIKKPRPAKTKKN